MSAQQRLYYWRGDASVHLNVRKRLKSGDEERGTKVQEPIAEEE